MFTSLLRISTRATTFWFALTFQIVTEVLVPVVQQNLLSRPNDLVADHEVPRQLVDHPGLDPAVHLVSAIVVDEPDDGKKN